MNEGKKTGIFCGVAAVTGLLAVFIGWPKSNDSDFDIDGGGIVDQPLFTDFKDPMAAASMKIVTFDDQQGTLGNFEVRKDAETGNWIIPSREGYPADAVEQMKNAANSLVDLKVLDVVPANVEDHDDFGVIEPKLEDLSVGDEGVGRLVTFKDKDQKTIASMIIGQRVKDTDDQIYVRKPGQDPVYVVALDDAPLTTKFQDWIEEDLLKLSSIEVDEMQVKDYSASLGMGGQISYVRKYEADLKKDGAQWSLSELREYDVKRPLADPKIAEVSPEQSLNTTKINAIQNALDDLKIVNVIRKPDGMSANLRAEKDFLNDQKALNSLAKRGFYPVPMGANGEIEILSANGELTVGLKDGVEYVLRFGNIAGVSEEADEDESEEEDAAAGGVNRYLLVTTRVDQAKFPAPDLQSVPSSLAELEEMERKQAEAESPLPPDAEPEQAASDEAKPDDSAEAKSVDEAASTDEAEMKDGEKAADDAEADSDTTEEPKAEDKPKSEKSADDKPAEDEKSKSGDDEAAGDNTEKKAADETDTDADESEASGDEESGEAEAEGSGSGSGTGQAFSQDEKEDVDKKEPATDENESDEAKSEQNASDKAKPVADETADGKPAAEGEDTDEAEETEEEKQERLEAVQEKITKENQRKLDERKDRLAKAEASVRDLNARFADWYYVIPEETYTKLTIQRSELFEDKSGTGTPGSSTGPGFTSPLPNIPNFGAPPAN